ncbi:MAG: glycosyltransferase family 2 protein [Gallionella sp.]|nr:glycosyltransferase family 2 protein [Gallionella sp.]
MTIERRITLVVFAYKQSGMIDAAIDSALAQVCEPIEIILSDDASPDDTYARMLAKAAAYQGPHQVVVRRNEKNLGINEHFNVVVQAAHGDLIVMMAGDDISLPDRVAHIAQAWDNSGQKLDLIASHLYDMNAEGEVLGVVHVDDLSQWHTVGDWVRHRPYIIGAAHAFTRRLFDHFGALQPHVAYEDQVNVLRALCAGGACTIDIPLVRYRRGGVSDRMRDFSGKHFLASVQRLNRIHVALHKQWLHDAQIAGCLDLVQRSTEKEYQRELFIQSLLESPNWYTRCQNTLRPSLVPLGWRVRKLIYLSWPGIAARIRYMQSASKQMRNGDRR